jgi:hypothetical protein
MLVALLYLKNTVLLDGCGSLFIALVHTTQRAEDPQESVLMSYK